MTIKVEVSVHTGATFKAKVMSQDYNEEGETVDSLAGIVPPGESSVFYATNTRTIVVSELALTEEDK